MAPVRLYFITIGIKFERKKKYLNFKFGTLFFLYVCLFSIANYLWFWREKKPENSGWLLINYLFTETALLQHHCHLSASTQSLGQGLAPLTEVLWGMPPNTSYYLLFTAEQFLKCKIHRGKGMTTLKMLLTFFCPWLNCQWAHNVPLLAHVILFLCHFLLELTPSNTNLTSCKLLLVQFLIINQKTQL